MPMPPQDELRRRLRGARLLLDLTLADVAGKIPPEAEITERALRYMETGQTRIKGPLLREIAIAMDVPYEFFVAPDWRSRFKVDRDAQRIFEARLRVLEKAAFEERLAALERRAQAAEDPPPDPPDDPPGESRENRRPASTGRTPRRSHPGGVRPT